MPNHPIRTTGLRLIASISASVEPKKVSFNAQLLKFQTLVGPLVGVQPRSYRHAGRNIGKQWNGLHGPILIDSYDTTIVVPPNTWVEKSRAEVTIYLD